MSKYFVYVSNFAALYGVMAAAAATATRGSGRAHFGIGVTALIAAYASAIFVLHTTQSPVGAVALAVGISAPISVGFALYLMHLRPDDAALGAYACAVACYSATKSWWAITGGTAGLPGLPPLFTNKVFGISTSLIEGFVPLIFCAIGVVILVMFERTVAFSAAVAASDDRPLLTILGYSPSVLHVMTIAVPNFVVAVAAATLPFYWRYISPQYFSPTEGIIAYAFGAIVGFRSAAASALCACALVVVAEVLRTIPFWDIGASAVRQLLVGLILVISILLQCGAIKQPGRD